MKSTAAGAVFVAAVFLAGATVPTVLFWNPGHWHWAESLTSRLRPQASPDAVEKEKQLWTCGMHPQVIQEEPGDCPICRMKLVPLKKQPAAQPETADGSKERKVKYWRAPMDPNYISDKPGKSPMGMDLIPVYEDEQAAESGIRVDQNFLQNFAVRTAVAQKGAIPIEIRTVGVLEYNEKDLALVNTKYEGWIEKVHVNYVGEQVRRGEVLFEIYSPQLVTTQQEYLSALEYVDKLAGRADPAAVERARSLLESARERLRYWDIGNDQIEELTKAGKPARTVKLVSPVSGVVAAKMSDSLEGMKVSPGMNVYKIADLSTIWAGIDVYENQLRYIQPGRRAVITVDAFPGRRWMAKVIYINPSMDPKTRTLKAYVEIPNQGGNLRPQMYANVEINVPVVSGAVKVPEQAVIHSGERSVVVIRKSDGLFEPREVQLGALGEGYREITRGVQAGETVVTSSQFLIDSESNLKAAIQKMLGERKPSPVAAPVASPKDSPPPMQGHQH